MSRVVISFLGDPDKVGRAAYLIRGSKSILIDYGVELTKPPKFPILVPPHYIDLFILSHSHLDHIGAAPTLYLHGNIPALMTKPTLELGELLIKDFIKLSGEYLPYEYLDFMNLANNTHFLTYKKNFSINDVSITFLDAGHIPGSCQVIVEIDGKRILYTGDINTYDTRLQNVADLNYEEEFDVVIIESTYAADVHPPRKKLERLFVKTAEEVVEDGGIALVPAFAVGRSQEILLILYHRKFSYNITMDGMALEATKILLNNPGYIKNYKVLKKAFKKIRKVYRWKERKKVIKEPGLIIAPAGMLGGGAAVYYINKLYKDPKNAIFLVGYQAPGSPGRNLLEARKLKIEEREKEVVASIYYMQFSAHTDSNGLKKVLSSLRGDPKIYIVHGERRGREALYRIASEEYGFKAYMPMTGEKYEV